MNEIELEIPLFSGLAFAYQPRPEDLKDEWIQSTSQYRCVTRRITNTFWFFREILPYGKGCAIMSLPEVRERFKEELRSLCSQYEI